MGLLEIKIRRIFMIRNRFIYDLVVRSNDTDIKLFSVKQQNLKTNINLEISQDIPITTSTEVHVEPGSENNADKG